MALYVVTSLQIRLHKEIMENKESCLLSYLVLLKDEPDKCNNRGLERRQRKSYLIN